MMKRSVSALACVTDAAVVGWPSREFNEEVAAFVLLKSPVDPQTLTDWCREALASYKVPRQIFIEHTFPRTSLGKVIKAELCTVS